MSDIQTIQKELAKGRVEKIVIGRGKNKVAEIFLKDPPEVKLFKIVDDENFINLIEESQYILGTDPAHYVPISYEEKPLVGFQLTLLFLLRLRFTLPLTYSLLFPLLTHSGSTTSFLWCHS
jgi:hypothetical protein